MKKRICLFAAYDKQSMIDDYVVYYIKELSKYADVYYFADNDMVTTEFFRIADITKYAKGQKHGRYDFGSWANIIQDIGFEKLEEYDSVILANDSCFGHLFDFEDLFNNMDSKELDAWSVCGNKFMMSFFISLNKNVIQHEDFRKLFNNIKEEEDKSVIIKKYERGLNAVVDNNGFKSGYYISGKDVKNFYGKNKTEIHKKINKVVPPLARMFLKFRPNKVRLYEDDFILPFFMKMPIMKKMSFLMGQNIMPLYAEEIIAQNSEFPVELITNYFNRVGVDIKQPLKHVIRNKIKLFIRNFIWHKKFRGNRYIIRVFNIPVYVKKMDYSVTED